MPRRTFKDFESDPDFCSSSAEKEIDCEVPLLKDRLNVKKVRFTDDDSAVECEESPGGGFGSSLINLLKTILGAGMLALPAAVASVGYLWGILLILLAAGLCAYSLTIYTVCATYAPGRTASIARLSKLTYPRLGKLFDLAMAVKCFGVAVSFLIVIGDLMPSLALGLGWSSPLLMSRVFWITAFMTFMVPLSFLRKLDSLKYSSLGGLVAVFYLVGLSIWSYFGPDAHRPPPNAEVELIAPFSMASLTSFPVFIFAFTCQQNILQIQNESKDNSARFMKHIFGWSLAISSAIYLIFSLFSYANFGQIVQNNVFQNYPVDSSLAVFGRCLFALLAAFSYPLQTHPCRASLINLLPFSKRSLELQDGLIYGSVTAVILAASYLVAWLQDDLRLVSGIIGTFVGIPICYILPFVFYNKLLIKETETESLPVANEQRSVPWTRMRIGAAGLAIFGIFAMILSGTALIAIAFYTTEQSIITID